MGIQVLSEGCRNFRIDMNGGTGDADLYVRKGQNSTTKSGGFDCGPEMTGNSEWCLIADPYPGIYYIDIWGYKAGKGITLKVHADKKGPTNVFGSIIWDKSGEFGRCYKDNQKWCSSDDNKLS